MSFNHVELFSFPKLIHIVLIDTSKSNHHSPPRAAALAKASDNRTSSYLHPLQVKGYVILMDNAYVQTGSHRSDIILQCGRMYASIFCYRIRKTVPWYLSLSEPDKSFPRWCNDRMTYSPHQTQLPPIRIPVMDHR